jgi:tetratricopeptide (TPR) repeat protein
MSLPFLRGAQLMQMGRYEAAEKELRQSILNDPNYPLAHVLLASCLLERRAYSEAQREAETAVGLAPDFAPAHSVLARVWRDRGYEKRAAQSVDEAIRLDPTKADFYALRSAIYFDASRWSDALASAETGLSFDAEHAQCNNLRAMALVKLGRKSEAGATIDASLARDPEDSYTHANKGWTLLEQRRTGDAITHFRESLRLDPTNDYARAGLVEALKARNPIYGLFLRYMLWMMKLPPKWRWGVVIGGLVGYNLLNGTANTHPELAPWIEPITTAYLVLVLFTWLAQPIFNLLLRLHPIGRHALSAEQRSETNWIGGCLLAALTAYGASFLGGWLVLLEETAMNWAMLTLPLHIVFHCRAERSKRIMVGATLALFGLSLAWLGAVFVLHNAPLARRLDTLFVYGWIASIWGGQALSIVRPRY